MVSIRELERQYGGLKKNIGTEEYSESHPVGRINCYYCKVCFRVTKTIDRHSGATPIMMNCPYCNAKGCTSSDYRDIAPDIKPLIEWYRPDFNEIRKKYRKKPSFLSHIFNGGLLGRKIQLTEKT